MAVKENRNLYDAVRATPLFSQLKEEEARSLVAIGLDRTFPARRILITEGDTSTDLYVVIEGKARAVGIDIDGRLIVHNVFGPGDYFGEMSFIDGEPRCATVETLQRTRLLIIPRNRFRKVLFANPDITFNLMKGLTEKLRDATRRIEELVFMDAYSRLSRLLLRLAPPGDGRRTVPDLLTQQDIAEMIGTSREMVSRVLTALVSGGYITRRNKRITIQKDLPENW
jgi:CRP/FNR family cyclic AMP-dependent transcriptional regulator